jgi:hypothetical protein
MEDLTRRRLKHNEAVFRAVNEEIDELSRNGTSPYVCECAQVSCTETIQLTRVEYRRIRSQAGHYVIVPGHEMPEIEDVVELAGDHAVVDKN